MAEADVLTHITTVPAEFEKLLNFRDVGQSVNQSLGTDVLQERCLFRSARVLLSLKALKPKVANSNTA